MQFVIAGALFGMLGVIAGAFGAHGLKDVLEPGDLQTFETAVRYQMYHALALVGLGLMPKACPRTQHVAGWSFVAGILIFSGSLYILVLSGARWLGAVTPIGGTLMILGWALLALAAWKQDCARSND
jgi:uncharacterized membrane protein YgdD (TMEM256/DUF423 family)